MPLTENNILFYWTAPEGAFFAFCSRRQGRIYVLGLCPTSVARWVSAEKTVDNCFFKRCRPKQGECAASVSLRQAAQWTMRRRRARSDNPEAMQKMREEQAPPLQRSVVNRRPGHSTPARRAIKSSFLRNAVAPERRQRQSRGSEIMLACCKMKSDAV